MRPNFSYLLAASNANLKPGGPNEEEAISERRKIFAAAHRSDKIIRLISLLPDMRRLLSPRPRHGKPHAHLSLNLCILSTAQSLLLPPLPGSRIQCSPTF